jgi:Kef-type K+ transport system membrane component KefB
MKKSNGKIWFYYVALIVLFGVLTFLLFEKRPDGFVAVGNGAEKVVSAAANGHLLMFLDSLKVNLLEPAAMLLLQIISIILCARIFGWLFAKMGQPTVIGEILAGIVLGPSLLGSIFPDVYHFLFAKESLGNLYILSQLGLILFMFTIGMELNLSSLKGKFGETWVISHSGILIPFFLGMLLAFGLYGEFVDGKTDFVSFALFMGISMSITAFPVLARIVQEKGLTKTHLGTISLASAAIGDVTAWCLLAAVIAIAKTGSVASSLWTLLFAAVYVCVMLWVIRPFLRKIGEIYGNAEVLNKSIVGFFLLVLVVSALTTQVIGIHALFGAFLAGVIMPPLPNFRKLMIDKIEDVSVTLLLPLFFVFTGLRTEVGLLNTPHLWAVCGWIILTAVVGKFGGTALPAAYLGEGKRNSLSMGVLMNTRGLMELIVLNIGYEMGILPPPIFVMLVIMALFTTFMTTPAMSLIEWIYPIRNIVEERNREQALGIFKALVACGNPENGKNLLNVAKTVLDGSKNSLAVTVMHLTVGTDVNLLHGEEYAVDSFRSVRQEADRLDIPIETRYRVTENIGHEIVHTVNTEGYDFLLVGAGVSLPGRSFLKKGFFYPGSLIKDKTRYFIESSKCSVGVFINRSFTKITKTVVFIEQVEDAFLLKYARRLLKNNGEVSVRIIDVHHLANSHAEMAEAIAKLKEEFPTAVRVARNMTLSSVSISNYSLMLIGYSTWNKYVLENEKALANIPSTLIINKKTSRFHAPKNHPSDQDRF